VRGTQGYLPGGVYGPCYPNSQHGHKTRLTLTNSICLLFFDFVTGEQNPFIRNVFTLNTCSHIVGSQVLSFTDEVDMLHAWREFVEKVDPDVVIGYNIAGFDFPYLMDRAKALKALKFPYLGRMKCKDV